MAGWGEPRGPVAGGTGSTGEIELAHAALDRVGVEPGTLARRVLVYVGRHHTEAELAEATQTLVDGPVPIWTQVREACLPNMRKQFAGDPLTAEDITVEEESLAAIRHSEEDD